MAAICHGPWMLVEADVVRGRTVTSWPSLKTDIRNAGGNWVDREVVHEQKLVTSRKPDDGIFSLAAEARGETAPPRVASNRLIRVAVLVAVVLSQALGASAGRVYLRRVEFEPHNARRPFSILPGSVITEQQAHQAAMELRQSLVAEGYRKAQVEANLLPAGPSQADLRFQVTRGPHYRIRQIAFVGYPIFPAGQLRHALHLQGAPYSDAEVGAGLARLRSFYLAHGYFDAHVEQDKATLAADKVALRIAVTPGAHYRVHGGEFPAANVCAVLLRSREKAEREGALDFSSRILLDPNGHDGVDYRLTTTQGPSYRVGRIEFRGDRVLRDSTLRRALVLNEGEILDGLRLRQSLARLSRLPLIEPVTEGDLKLIPHDSTRSADVIITVHERPRGRWAFSGPALPFALAGAFEAMIMSRLPAWGQGLFEGSTWYGMFALTGLPPSLARMLPFAGKKLLPFFGFGRPFLPGQFWTSGFFYSPELGWQSLAMSYGAYRVQALIRKLLRLDSLAPPAVAAPLAWHELGHPDDAVLLCNPPGRHGVKKVLGAVSAFALGAAGP